MHCVRSRWRRLRLSTFGLGPKPSAPLRHPSTLGHRRSRRQRDSGALPRTPLGKAFPKPLPHLGANRPQTPVLGRPQTPFAFGAAFGLMLAAPPTSFPGTLA